MGTRKSRHNKGRKPSYKDHRAVAEQLLKHPRATTGNGEASWAWTRTWWSDIEKFKLNVLCEADSHVEGAADVLGRTPTSIAHYARDSGLTLPTQWSRLITPKRASKIRVPKSPLLPYPFITKSRPEHADLIAINQIVPNSVPDHMRGDICQEIMLAILEGRTTLEALRAREGTATYYIKKFWHENYEAGGHAISFQDTKDDWNSDHVASGLAAKEWARDRFQSEFGQSDAYKFYTPPTQFEAAYRDQVGKVTLRYHELGQFLSHEEVEELLDEGD